MSGPLRVGILGAGWWAAENHMPILAARPDVQITAVGRHGTEALERVRARFDVPFATEDADALLAHPELDAVVIATPHALHAEQAIAALGRGLHVLVEKPVAIDAAAARDLERAAAATDRVAMVPFGWNFTAFAAAARGWVAEGRIGRVRHVSAQMASPIGDLMGGRDYAGTEGALFRPDPATWSDPATGGYGWGQLVHLLALLFHVAPLTPHEVLAMTDAREGACDLHDAAVLRTEEGATVALSGAATLPPGSRFQIDIRLFGTEGCLLLDVERERLALIRQDGRTETFPMAEGDGTYTCEAPVHRFVDLCLGRAGENPAGLALARVGCDVVAAMHASAARGRSQRITEPA